MNAGHDNIGGASETSARHFRMIAPAAEGRTAHGLPPKKSGTESPVSARERRAMFDAMVRELKAQYKISIRRWRRQMSGVAYELTFRDGTIKRVVTAPRPKTSVSASIFLHEVGHHAVGFKRYDSRCLEEFYAWQWAFREMRARGIEIDERVLRHYRRSMYHYVRMAKRRGHHHVPHELEQFSHWPG